MKKLSLLFSLILTFILAFSSLACGGSQVLNLTAFTTVIRVEAHDKKIFSQTRNQLTELFSELEKEFDKNEQGSIIASLNASQPLAPVTLSERSAELLELAKNYYEFSSGRFNPAVARLVELWQFDAFGSVVSFVPPTNEKVLDLMQKNTTAFSKIVTDGQTAYRTDGEIEIDLGGLVKGYAVDKALEIMLDDGHVSGYISVGNSSLALLSVPSLNVSHPRKKGESILSINTQSSKNITLSTSGDYERYFEYNGERYSHILDPETGYPIKTGIAGATVIGGTGAFTDAITTALCVCKHNPNDFSSSELVSFMNKIINEYPQIELYVVYEKDGIKQLITNEKQGKNFTLLDNEYTVKNI